MYMKDGTSVGRISGWVCQKYGSERFTVFKLIIGTPPRGRNKVPVIHQEHIG